MHKTDIRAYRRAVNKVVDVMEGHGEGGEWQHHTLLYIALLEADATHLLPGALTGTPQSACTGRHQVHADSAHSMLMRYTAQMLSGAW